MILKKHAFLAKIKKIAGKLTHINVSAHQLSELFADPEHMYDGQRDHDHQASKKKHTQRALKGDSQMFHGVYILETQQYVNIDGYHRAYHLKTGEAWFAPGADITLTVHVVETKAEADELYEQYNSSVAAKKSSCYFDSGLRKIGAIRKVRSNLIIRGPKSTAVQTAAGIKGTAATKKAVVAMKRGILGVNALDLDKNHETAGVLGAYFAIAQHCRDKRLVDDFIRNMNMMAYEPVRPSKAERDLEIFHRELRLMKAKNGSDVTAIFQKCLAAFTRYAYLSRGRRAAVDVEVNLPSFIAQMEAFPVRK